MKAWYRPLCLLLWLCGAPVVAHQPGDSYLTLNVVDAAAIDVQWDIALRDLDFQLGIDTNGDGAMTWGELESRHGEVAELAASSVSIGRGDVPCRFGMSVLLVDYRLDEAYAVLRFPARCPATAERLRITYRLFFDVNAQHRGIINVVRDGVSHPAVFSPERDTWTVDDESAAVARDFTTWLGEGIRHIWTGFDHVLFLLCLLLPAVLARVDGRWRPVATFRRAAIDVVKLVTAFTVAHSVTLTLAALDLIAFSVRWVEVGIAASVVIAAFNNLYPIVWRGIWGVAFAFGLVHGLGFANVLKDIGLPESGRLWALLAFNLGVEAGQLAIVLVVLPLVYVVRKSELYQSLVLRVGSFAILLVGAFWLIRRLPV